MQLRFPFMLTITIAALLATSTLVFTAEESADKPAAKTTANPDIPADELALMLHPFTKAELLIETDGWQALVRENASEHYHIIAGCFDALSSAEQESLSSILAKLDTSIGATREEQFVS